MAVRIRLKRMGRRHRPFFYVCAMDQRTPRHGRVLEQLGTYDPGVPEVDARARLNGERVDYWLSVGAQPSPKAGVLIKKYGAGGTHIDAQKAALERLARPRPIPDPGPPASPPPKPAKAQQVVPRPPATPAEEHAVAVESAVTASSSVDQSPAETADAVGADQGGSDGPPPSAPAG